MTIKMISGLVALVLTAMPSVASAQRMDPAQAFDHADSNRDGRVSRAEFVAARTARFDKMDRNGDGIVNKEDLKRLARFKPDLARKMEAMIAAMDSNGDGHVTRAELAGAPTPIFERADADDDGIVDQTELATWRASAKSLIGRQ